MQPYSRRDGGPGQDRLTQEEPCREIDMEVEERRLRARVLGREIRPHGRAQRLAIPISGAGPDPQRVGGELGEWRVRHVCGLKDVPAVAGITTRPGTGELPSLSVTALTRLALSIGSLKMATIKPLSDTSRLLPGGWCARPTGEPSRRRRSRTMPRGGPVLDRHVDSIPGRPFHCYRIEAAAHDGGDRAAGGGSVPDARANPIGERARRQGDVDHGRGGCH